jgi:hypothetical protein
MDGTYKMKGLTRPAVKVPRFGLRASRQLRHVFNAPAIRDHDSVLRAVRI